MSDCAFIVEEEEIKTKIPCHKYILGCCSWEFYKLFYLMEGDSKVTVSDVSLNVVKKCLEFIYKETTEIDMEIVWDVLKLGKRFKINNLIEFCEKFLAKNVDEENVFIVFENSAELELGNVVRTVCVDILGRLQLDEYGSFFKMSQESIIFFLESDKSNKKEIEIFRLINQWAEHKCKQNKEIVNSTNKIRVLGEAVNKIRFGTMTIEEFTECILYEHCFLTDKQTVDILKCIGSSGEHDCGFSSIERYGILKTITVSGDIVSSHKSIWYPTEFSSNNPINLVGMGIYGRKTNITSKSVKFIIKLKCDERINFVSKNEFEINFDGTDKIYQVIFKVPIPLEANLLYTAKMKDNSADDYCEYFCRDCEDEDEDVGTFADDGHNTFVMRNNGFINSFIFHNV